MRGLRRMTDEKEGNPYVGDSLCSERMGFMGERINNMESKILFTVKISALLLGLAVTLLQLGLHYLA